MVYVLSDIKGQKYGLCPIRHKKSKMLLFLGLYVYLIHVYGHTQEIKFYGVLEKEIIYYEIIYYGNDRTILCVLHCLFVVLYVYLY